MGSTSMGSRDRSNIGGGFIFETSGRGSAEVERFIDEKNPRGPSKLKLLF